MSSTINSSRSFHPTAFLSSAKLDKGDPSMVALASVLLNLDETLMSPDL